MAGFCSDGAVRAATAALAMQGETAVFLRLPGPALNGNDGEQLGLCTLQFSDAPLGPAAWRKAGKTTELLVAAECISALMGMNSFASAESLFSSAVGVIVAEVLYVIEDSSPLIVAGRPCAYRLTLEGPART